MLLKISRPSFRLFSSKSSKKAKDAEKTQQASTPAATKATEAQKPPRVIPPTFMAIKEQLPPLPSGSKTTYEALWFDPSDAMTATRIALFKKPQYVENIVITCQALAKRGFDYDVDASTSEDKAIKLRTQLDKVRIVPFAREGFDCMVSSADASMRSSSSQLKRGLESNYQVVIIGAGPHGITAATTIKAARPDAQVLVVERAESPMMADNFGATGRSFKINSRNGAETAGEAEQSLGTGDGDINPIGGALSVPAVTGDRWPAGEVIQQVATLNAWMTGSPMMFGTNVTKIGPNKSGSGANYQIAMTDRESGRQFFTNADFVFLCTGLGASDASLEDPKSNELVAKELKPFWTLNNKSPRDANTFLETANPGIRTAKSHFLLARYQGDVNKIFRPEEADRKKAEKARGTDVPYYKFVVVGLGDTARTLVEFASGEAPTRAYNSPSSTASAQQGTLGLGLWLTGNQGPETCAEFVRTERARYSPIAAVLRSRPGRPAKIALRAARATAVEGNQGNYTLTLNNGFGRRAEKVRAGYIVFAAGYKSETFNLLDSTLLSGSVARSERDRPLERSLFVQSVRDTASTPSTKLAKRVVDQNIFLLGPAAGTQAGDLVDGNPAGIQENRAGLAATINKTIGLSQGVAMNLGTGYAVSAEQPKPLSLEAAPGETSAHFPSRRNWTPPSKDTETVILSAANQRLATAQLSGPVGEVSLEFDRDVKKGMITLKANGLSQTSVNKLAESFAEDEAIIDHIDSHVRNGATLEITYPRAENTAFFNVAAAKMRS